jgi:hypothetical protein
MKDYNDQVSEIIHTLKKTEDIYEHCNELANENERTSEINDALTDTPNRCLESNGKSEGHGSGSFSDSPVRVIKGRSFKSNDVVLTDSPIRSQKTSNRKTSSHDDLVDTPLCARNSDEHDGLASASLADTPISIEVAAPTDSHLPTSSIKDAKITKKQKLEKIKKLQKKNISKGVAKYFDLEADASESDDDEDEDEDENLSQDSFINDSSQLDYTQAGSVSFATQSTEKKDRYSISMYRRINNSNTLNDLFSTPLLNRRSKSSEFSCPSSDAHLGKMNFIRSVIEHHQRGGSANELEKQYNTIMNVEGTPTEKRGSTSPQSNVPHSKPPLKLTAEQMARVEVNRKQALLRRQAANKKI